MGVLKVQDFQLQMAGLRRVGQFEGLLVGLEDVKQLFQILLNHAAIR